MRQAGVKKAAESQKILENYVWAQKDGLHPGTAPEERDESGVRMGAVAERYLDPNHCLLFKFSFFSGPYELQDTG